MPILKPINHPGDLAQIINYCNMDGVRGNQNDIKGLTFGINCSGLAEQAIADMKQVKKLYHKEGKRQYQHYILSFAQNEFAKGDPKVYQEALNYGIKLASKIWGKRYQVFLALHTNSKGVESCCEDASNGGCLHIHIIINSVSIVDGSKIRSSKDDLNLYRNINDSIAKEYGFTVIDRTPEAVALRDRPQIYDNNAYQIYLHTRRVHKRNIRLLTFNAVIKTLRDNPKNWEDFQAKILDNGAQATIRGTDISVRYLKDDSQQYSFRLSKMAKMYNNHEIAPYNILKKLNHPNYESFKRTPKPWRQQCADDILWVLEKKKPKKLEDFYQAMDEKGWIARITYKRNLVFERKNIKRRSGRPIKYSANVMANVYGNPMLSAQLILQSCGVPNYVEYAPKHSPIGPKVQEASNNLAKQLAAQAALSQPPAPKPNKMIVDLKSHDDKKQSRDDSLSW